MTLNIVVGIPTVGRASIVHETLIELRRQSRLADSIIVCGARPSDVEGVAAAYPDVIVLISEQGLPRQRNAIIEAAAEADVVIFFDDDFLADPDYLRCIEQQMLEDPGIVVATGLVLADGIGGPGFVPDHGRAILSGYRAATDGRSHDVRPTFSAYGCNMAVRTAAMREHSLRFDERLPLYGWQEDVDLSRRLAAFGRVVQVDAACGVHLGVKSGRSSGLRLGYSQVANPLYPCSKRRGYPFRRAVTHIAKNMVTNIVRSVWPEPYVDRRGRLRGNLLALRDLTIGRMVPERILDL
jgi:GT2 family glycosyltransferase